MLPRCIFRVNITKHDYYVILYHRSWSCQASAELRLISQKGGVPNFTRKTNHVYTSKENDWGYSCFMTWADILDESQGYIKEDKVVLEIHVKADPPKNILYCTTINLNNK